MIRKRRKRESKKNITANSLVIMVLCAALITVGLVLLFFSMFAVFQVDKFKMSLDVSDRSSFHIDSETINFGKGAPGNSNSRVIVLSHSHTSPLLISFRGSGNISRFVDLPDDFYLEPGLSKEITLSAVIPKDEQKGHYEGTLTVYFRRI